MRAKLFFLTSIRLVGISFLLLPSPLSYPTDDALLISFRLSSDAEIFC